MRHAFRRNSTWAIVALVVFAILAGGALLASSLNAQRHSGSEITRRFENVLTVRRTSG